ncbi:MAG: tetratricopeptide repeat protein [Halioglobus sp.]|nr:tetratricopeptide repeat protein [Halioglobus sp.]
MNNPSPVEYTDWEQAMAIGNRSARRGDLAGALQAFDAAVRQWPEHAAGWINLGSTLVQCQQYAAAANVMSQAVDREPGNAHCFTVLGDATRMLGQRKTALKCYEEAVRLERSPDNLNRLAVLRGTLDDIDAALPLFDEALAARPDFDLARINRAILLIERQEFGTAVAELRALDPAALLPPEREVLGSTLTAVSERERLGEHIQFMIDNGDVGPLASALRELPPKVAQFDRKALQTVATYAKRVATFTLPDCPLNIALPEDWALIEGLHMVPHVHSVAEFLALRAPDRGAVQIGSERHESLSMEPAIQAAQLCLEDMTDPPLAEAHLRHWHSLCTRDVAGFMPGHLKYTPNGCGKSPTLPRVNPACASGTLQLFIRNMYPRMPAGMARGMLAFLAILDLHPFADGNGRVAMTWLNRELIWAGQMPALFSRDNSLKGALGAALRDVRNNGGDLTPMIAAIHTAQNYTRAFCEELASR